MVCTLFHPPEGKTKIIDAQLLLYIQWLKITPFVFTVKYFLFHMSFLILTSFSSSKGFFSVFFPLHNGNSHTLQMLSVSFLDTLAKGDIKKFFVSFSIAVDCTAFTVELAFCPGQVVIKCAGNRKDAFCSTIDTMQLKRKK